MWVWLVLFPTCSPPPLGLPDPLGLPLSQGNVEAPLLWLTVSSLSCHQKECLDFMLNILDASRTSKPQQGAWEHLRENIRGICFYKGKETNKASVWGWFFHPRLYIQVITLDMGFFYYYHPS